MTAIGTAHAQIVELGRALYERSITPGRTGNLSVRVGDRFVMTPTGISLGRLDPDRLSLLDAEGTLLTGAPPSKEWSLHLACYQRDPEITAVAHVHSVHAVAVSLLTGLDPETPIPPLTAYYAMRVGRLPLIDYHRPGDPALARALRYLPAGTRCALLANHGSIAGAVGLEAALDAIEEIEETARLVLLLNGRDIRPLTREQVESIGDG